MSIRLTWLLILVKSSVFLLVFSLLVLSVTERVLKYLLSLSAYLFFLLFQSVFVLCIFTRYIKFLFVLSSWWVDLFIIIKWLFLSLVIFFVLKPTLPYINMETSTFLWLVIEWNIFFYTLNFNFFLCLFRVGFLKFDLAFKFQSNNLCLFIVMIKPFTFNVINDMVGFDSTILLFIW